MSETSSKPEMRVAIIGGGIIGCACAYYLAQNKIKSQLFESKTIAHAASGKAGGFLARCWCDEDDASLRTLARESYELHKKFADNMARKGIELGYRAVRAWSVEVTDGTTSHSLASKIASIWNTMGTTVAGCKLIGELEDCAQITPKLLCECFLNESKTMCTVHCHTHITSISLQTCGAPHNMTITSIDGQNWTFQGLIICGGVWTENLLQTIHHACQSTEGHLDPLRDTRIIQSNALCIPLSLNSSLIPPDTLFIQDAVKKSELDALEDSTIEIYPRPDKSIYLCGVSCKSKFAPSLIDENLKHKLVSGETSSTLQQLFRTTLTCLDNIRITENESIPYREQTCHLLATSTGTPIIGTLSALKNSSCPSLERVWVATAHAFWGILLSHVTGHLISEDVRRVLLSGEEGSSA